MKSYYKLNVCVLTRPNMEKYNAYAAIYPKKFYDYNDACKFAVQFAKDYSDVKIMIEVERFEEWENDYTNAMVMFYIIREDMFSKKLSKYEHRYGQWRRV